jgi:hypothetical protein
MVKRNRLGLAGAGLLVLVLAAAVFADRLRHRVAHENRIVQIPGL